jgi:Uma2 family endonuclease
MSTITKPVASQSLPDRTQVPELENGDHLSRAEFERRYDAMPELKKAELIEGVVYVPSPVRHRHHSRPHAHVLTWLGSYEAGTPGVEPGDNGSIHLDLDNMPQTDAYLIITSECAGQAKIDDDGYIAGAPELVAEVATSSVSYDLGVKRRVYRRNGVREYVVWRVQDQQIDWFVLREGEYVTAPLPGDGVQRSAVFPGLWLDVEALLAGDLARVLAVLQDGLKSPEHAKFVTRLKTAK